MGNISIVVRTLAGCVALALFAGCAASSHKHPWEPSRAEVQEIRSVTNWPVLSTNDYVRVPEAQTLAAVAMLKDVPFVHLDASQISIFAPNFSAPDRPNLEPYLVRGLTFISHPIYTLVRFDASTGGLSIKQATYNGEMLLPYSSEQSNALVVWLSRPPARVYPLAVMAGDGVWSGGSDHR